ncbi:hypothetical protein [Enterococcus sp. CSURQ0835]|uniref:hypothetical protein n=1 Tax=Enterococcus sp. CSURQ0835 TaxID=2681394 RepID=UPI001358058E|nr:hypothetical protein [Enterococcus sp. CSURQ0835]
MEAVNQQMKIMRKRKVLIALLLSVLLVTGYVVYEYFLKKETIPATVVAGDFLPAGKDAAKMTEKELSEYAQKAADESQFNMRIVSKAAFDQTTMNGKLAIQNPPINSQPVNVVVTLDDTNEVVYNSGAIQPGEEITEAMLEKRLEAGEYQATATFNIYNPATNKKQGEVQSLLTIMVQ